jgi:hypothetical protein
MSRLGMSRGVKSSQPEVCRRILPAIGGDKILRRTSESQFSFARSPHPSVNSLVLADRPRGGAQLRLSSAIAQKVAIPIDGFSKSLVQLELGTPTQ